MKCFLFVLWPHSSEPLGFHTHEDPTWYHFYSFFSNVATIFCIGPVTPLTVWIHTTLSFCLSLQCALASLDRSQSGFLGSFLPPCLWSLFSGSRVRPHFSVMLLTLTLPLLPGQFLAEGLCDYRLPLPQVWSMGSQTGLWSKPHFCLFVSSEAQIDLKLNILSINYLGSKRATPHSPWPWTSYVAEDNFTLVCGHHTWSYVVLGISV